MCVCLVMLCEAVTVTLQRACLRLSPCRVSPPTGGEGDYVQWLAHSSDLSDPSDGCLLGYKEHFLRLRKDSICWNGRDYIITTQAAPCSCTLDDYHWCALLNLPHLLPLNHSFVFPSYGSPFFLCPLLHPQPLICHSSFCV